MGGSRPSPSSGMPKRNPAARPAVNTRWVNFYPWGIPSILTRQEIWKVNLIFFLYLHFSCLQKNLYIFLNIFIFIYIFLILNFFLKCVFRFFILMIILCRELIRVNPDQSIFLENMVVIRPRGNWPQWFLTKGFSDLNKC